MYHLQPNVELLPNTSPKTDVKSPTSSRVSTAYDQISNTTLSLVESYCAFYVNHPKLSFVITLCIQLSLVLITAVLYVSAYDIFPYDFTQVPLNLEHDPTKLRADAFNFVTEDQRIDLLPATAIPRKERTSETSPLELVYCSKQSDSNILTSANLRHIASLERQLFDKPSFQKICHLNDTQQCSMPKSLIQLFDGTFAHLHPVFNDRNFENIDQVLLLASNISHLKPLLAFSLDTKSRLGADRVYATYMRSLMFTGTPLKGYRHGEDRKKEQLSKLKQHIVDAFGELLAEKYEQGVGDIRVFYMNLDLFFNAVEKQVVWDLLLAGGSLVFIFCFIWFQTGSLWITGWAVFGILTNFFGANLFYRIVLDFRFIGIFHVLSVFIILGIGADDVFVFYNTWKLMETKNFSSLKQHLTETFRVASSAMFVTSLTTAAAFFASAASPLLGVSSFGVFSGILVIVNYLSICIFFPSVVVTYHLYWKQVNICAKQDPCIVTDQAPQDDMTRMFKAIVKWFETSYANKFILHPRIKWVLLLVFVTFSSLFLAFALKLSPQEEQVQIWPKGTNWYDMRQIKLNSFTERGEGMNVIRVYTVWGLKLQDRSRCHFTDYQCKGSTVFDEEFDMNQPGCQEAILGFCKRLKGLSNREAEKLAIRRNIASGELEVACFIDEMDKYFRSESREGYQHYTRNPIDFNFSIPIDETKVRALMDSTPLVYSTANLSTSYHRYFEVALGYWLSGGGHQDQKFDYYKFASYMGGTLDKTASSITPLTQAQGGKFGNRMRYVAVVVNTTLTGSTLKYKRGNDVYNSWENFVKTQTKNMPRACRNAFQCTPEWNNWHWLRVQSQLLIGARNGIMIGLCLAFPMLVLATFNWIIGVLATLVIGLITLAVVGLIPLVGWNLGVLESINLTLVVGLAVDYAVHLADGYVRSLHYKRCDRVRYMLGHVGVSVLAGASTTLGASAFMLGSKIKFFLQFGTFMFCTIGFSIVYALILFALVAGLIGPEGNNGSLPTIVNCFKRKKKPEEEKENGHMLTESPDADIPMVTT